MSNSVLAKLRYVEVINRDATTTSVAQYAFRLNSLYDPNVTGTGTQPMGFDEYATFYNHYEVIGCLARITFSGTDETANNGAIVGMRMQRSSTGASTIPEMLQSSTCDYKVLNSGQYPVTLSRYWNIKKSIGLKDRERALSAEVTTNPAEEVFLLVFATNIDPTATQDPQNVNIVVDLTYYAKFRERKELSES